MIDLDWIQSTPTAMLMVVLTTLGIYLSLMLFTRLSGLRSFSKMSSFDFAITVAMGSLIATVILSDDPPLVQGITGLAALFGIQFIVSALRRRWKAVIRVVDNAPLLLMAGSEVLPDNLTAGRVTMNDLRAKLREANVIHLQQVRAVVMESTGDISVLHAGSDGPDLDLGLFDDVRGAEVLRALPDTRTKGEGGSNR